MDRSSPEWTGCCRQPGQPLVDRGDPMPLGRHECCAGTNLAVFSRHATGMELLLYDEPRQVEPSWCVNLDPGRHRTGDVWHVRLAGQAGRYYAFRATGPQDARHRFDPSRPLLDPYAGAVIGPDAAVGWRAVMADQSFDWQDDAAPRRRWGDTIIYETHVRGLTIHPSSAAHHPGQYLGLVEKIPYFKELGITALELLPIHAFDPTAIARRNPLNAEQLRDYWGYNPIGLFAPMASYAGDVAPGRELLAVKTMVRELHKAGIEVILDVVFNHTAEGGGAGPIYSFRGLDNAIYYLLTPQGEYADFTGCGNTLNCNHPVVRSMIVDCLRHWVVQFHIDGFRFDLASVLGRNQQGELMANPPLLEQIAEDPILRDTKLIAEAWDAAGAFQLGRFPGQRWAEWNCHFRDDVRRFWRGDPGFTGAFATRLAGSSDLYQGAGDSPLSSINFVTSHDGFTLNDLVSFAGKHNHANGEDNRDGAPENFSENNGVEGASDDPDVETVRHRQIKNFLASLLLSRGVPMILGGDEFRRTQAGNNNAYCQDNPTSWYDWSLVRRNVDLIEFVRQLISLRKAHPVLRAETFYSDREITWLGPEGSPPDWHGADNCLGCVIEEKNGGVCLLFNAGPLARQFIIPLRDGGRWHVALNSWTSRQFESADMIPHGRASVPSRATLVLEWRPETPAPNTGSR